MFETIVPIGRQLSFFEEIPGDVICQKRVIKRKWISKPSERKPKTTSKFDMDSYRYRRSKEVYEL